MHCNTCAPVQQGLQAELTGTGLLHYSPGLSGPGINWHLLMSPTLAGGFFALLFCNQSVFPSIIILISLEFAVTKYQRQGDL